MYGDVVLSPRLYTVAGMVKLGRVAADIGTDHGYLPVYLIQSYTSYYAYACDINPNPLEKAKKTIAEYDMGKKIEIVLCDGLSGLDPKKVDEIIIAGMGGETIIKILSECPWKEDQKKHYILQPMTKAAELRRYLYENGFVLEREEAVEDAGHVYTVMSVYYKGRKFVPDDLFQELGLHLVHPQESAAYIRQRAEAIRKRAEGISKIDPEAGKALYELHRKILESLEYDENM